ncbi:MAG: hypothetical protein Q7S19_00975 [bacterium]|nr:hypothetical protein [bacterium]
MENLDYLTPGIKEGRDREDDELLARTIRAIRISIGAQVAVGLVKEFQAADPIATAILAAAIVSEMRK